jgi:branched-chain amino acid transport system ATP-binding protein
MSDDTTTGRAPVLEAASIDMRFGGVRALSEVDIALVPGQWTGLIGPNGSGKTTLLNVLSGIYLATNGTVRLDGHDITKAGPRTVSRRGLVRTFQHPQLAETLTIGENVLLGADLAARRGRGRRDEAAAREVLELFGCGGFADQLPDAVPYGTRKMAELARAMLAEPLVLLLDEPAAGLSREERAELVAALRAVREQYPDLAVCLVEHDVRLVAAVCERMQALNFGKAIATGTSAEVLANEEVRVAYLGRSAARFEVEVTG